MLKNDSARLYGYRNVHRPREAFTVRRLEHNNAKRVLIDWAVWWLERTSTALTYADVCSGKGGDVYKVMRHPLLRYDASDIAPEAIAEARRRARHRTGYTFAVRDGAAHLPRDTYGVVSMQFALQHFCDSRARCAQLVAHVSRALVRGGLWIGTTVREASLPLPRDAPAFGAAYDFELPGVIDRATEYRVPQAQLREICRDCGLQLCFWRTLHAWLLGANEPSTDESNHCYCVFAFIKVTP